MNYQPAIRKVRDANMSFTQSDSKFKSQGGDFVLEGKVKRQKLLVPNGPVKADTWKSLARCLDEFEEIYAASNKHLKIQSTSEKIVDLVSEISIWQSVLRSSNYLSTDNFSDSPKNIFGELLSQDVVSLSMNAKKKRMEVWKQIESNLDICSAKVDFIRVIPHKDIDDLLYDVH